MMDFTKETTCINCTTTGIPGVDLIVVGKTAYCEVCFDNYKDILRKRQPDLEKKTSTDYTEGSIIENNDPSQSSTTPDYKTACIPTTPIIKHSTFKYTKNVPFGANVKKEPDYF